MQSLLNRCVVLNKIVRMQMLNCYLYLKLLIYTILQKKNYISYFQAINMCTSVKRQCHLLFFINECFRLHRLHG